MRRLARTLIAVMFLTVGGWAVAGPAGAAPEPARPYSIDSFCFDFLSQRTCLSASGVIKEETSASGNTLYKASGTRLVQIFVNGQLTSTSSSKDNFVLVGNSAGVLHSNGRTESVISDGMSCTFTYNYTYANGVMRHEVFDGQCSG